MIEQIPDGWILVGPQGRLLVPEQDALTPILSTPPCANSKCATKILAVHFAKCNYPTSVFFV